MAYHYSETATYLRPNWIMFIDKFESDGKGKSRSRISESDSYKKTKERDKRGGVSATTKRKINNAFQWLIAISNIKKVYMKALKKSFTFKLCFITLTLSAKQVHDDRFIKEKMLEQFLKALQRHHGVKSYIWKAEVQKNGNIHFHITTNQFIHYNSIRLHWNKLQQRFGYIPASELDLLSKSLPSTEIKSVRNDDKLIKYLVNYFLKKQVDRREIVGQVWNCSKNLKSGAMCFNSQNPMTNEEYKQMVNNLVAREVDSLYSKIFILKYGAHAHLPQHIVSRYIAHLAEIAKGESSQIHFTSE